MSGDGGAASGSVREERARPRRVESHEHGVETCATDESQSDQSPQSVGVSKMCLSGLRRGPSCHVDGGANVRACTRGMVEGRWDRPRPGSSVQCPCAQSAPTLSLRMANRTFCFKSLTQPEPVYRPRASSARCACQYTPKACTLTIISWYLRGPRGPCGCVSGWRSRAHV